MIGQIDSTSNPFSLFCACKNSKELTLDGYAKIESQKSGISVNEFASSVEALMEDNQSWLVMEFISDQVYMSNLIKVGSEMQTKAKDGQITEKEVEKIMKKIETDFPVCWIILPVLLSLAR